MHESAVHYILLMPNDSAFLKIIDWLLQPWTPVLLQNQLRQYLQTADKALLCGTKSPVDKNEHSPDATQVQ